MLTPQQVTQFRSSAGLSANPPAPTQPNTSSIIASRKASLGMGTPAPQTSSPIADTYNTTMKNSFDAETGAAQNMASSIQTGANNYESGVNAMNTGGDIGTKVKGLGQAVGGLGQAAVGAVAGVGNMVLSPVAGAIKTASDALSNSPEVQKWTQDPTVSQTLTGFADLSKRFSDLQTSHPEAAQTIGNVLGTILLGAGGNTDLGINAESSGLNDVKSAVSNGIPKVQEAVSQGLRGGINAVSGIGEKVSGATDSIKEAISPSLTPEEQIGKIIQGKTTDIPAAQRTFSKLPDEANPTKVKMSSSDVSDAVQKKIDENMNATSARYANDTTLHQMSEFEQTVGEGKSAVKTNPVQDAIDGLKEHYTATKNAQGLSDIKALEEKANTEGLTSGELDKLAKEQGIEINSYKANGDLASSQKAQAAENTRAGVKATARQILGQTDPEGAAEVTRLDRETSDAIHTKDVVDKQAQRESTTVQKKGKPNAIDRFAKNNPKTAKVIKYGGTALIGGEAIKHVLP